MAKLSQEMTETVWSMKRQLLDIVDAAKAAEFVLFERWGETDRTISYLEELSSVAEKATNRFSQFYSLQIRIANSQLAVPADMLELVTEVIVNTQQRLPAWERSIQEVKNEWRLP